MIVIIFVEIVDKSDKSIMNRKFQQWQQCKITFLKRYFYLLLLKKTLSHYVISIIKTNLHLLYEFFEVGWVSSLAWFDDFIWNAILNVISFFRIAARNRGINELNVVIRAFSMYIPTLIFWRHDVSCLSSLQKMFWYSGDNVQCLNATSCPLWEK